MASENRGAAWDEPSPPALFAILSSNSSAAAQAVFNNGSAQAREVPRSVGGVPIAFAPGSFGWMDLRSGSLLFCVFGHVEQLFDNAFLTADVGPLSILDGS